MVRDGLVVPLEGERVKVVGVPELGFFVGVRVEVGDLVGTFVGALVIGLRLVGLSEVGFVLGIKVRPVSVS